MEIVKAMSPLLGASCIGSIVQFLTFKTKDLLTAPLIAICGHKVSDSTALKF